MSEEKSKKCSFCGESENSSEAILFKSMVNEDVYICENCLNLCIEAMNESKEEAINQLKNSDIKDLSELSKIFKADEEFKPSEFKAFFDKYIINQDRAKKVLSVAIYNHYKRTIYNKLFKENTEASQLKKSNILMLGPSGCGKTLFVETMAKKLGIPLAISDATSLTQAG